MLLSLALTAVTALAPVFPARTPAQVVALATQAQVTGAATYDAAQDGAPYRFSLARRGAKVRGRFATAGGGVMWVGYERGAGVTFVCVRPRGQRITCQRGDPGGSGLRILASLGAPVASDSLRRLLTPLTVNGRGTVAQRRTAGRRVSCLSGRVAGKLREACATAYGVPTSVRGPGGSATAVSTTPTVRVQDVGPPARLPAR